MSSTQRNSLVPQTLNEAMEFSKILSQSAMIPRDYQGKPANVLVAVQWGMELGLAPMQALQNIAVINGKPSVYGDALLAMVRADTRCRGVNERNFQLTTPSKLSCGTRWALGHNTQSA